MMRYIGNSGNMTPSDYVKIGVQNGQYPAKLYKYYTLNKYLLESVKQHYMWFNAFEDYNDPYEGMCRYKTRYSTKTVLEYMYKLYGMVPPASNTNKESTKQVIKVLGDSIKNAAKNVRVCCFSKKWDNLLMWAHYANSYHGVCFEFDTVELSKTARFLLPVTYQKKYYIVDYFKDQASTIKQMALTKAWDWKYEEEFRLLNISNPNKMVPFNMKALTTIIVGPKCNVNGWHFRRLKKALPSHVVIKYSEVDPNEYRLVIK